MKDAIQNEPVMSSNIVFISTVYYIFLVWKSNEWRGWLQDMNNFAVTTRLIINIHTAKFWRVWDEVFSHRMHTLSHRHFALAFASTYLDANARWNKCKQKQRKWARAPQEEERTSFSFTASTAALGRDGSIHTVLLLVGWMGVWRLLYWPWLSWFRQPELQRERRVPGSRQLRPFIPLSAGLV